MCSLTGQRSRQSRNSNAWVTCIFGPFSPYSAHHALLIFDESSDSDANYAVRLYTAQRSATTIHRYTHVDKSAGAPPPQIAPEVTEIGRISVVMYVSDQFDDAWLQRHRVSEGPPGSRGRKPMKVNAAVPSSPCDDRRVDWHPTLTALIP